MKQTLIDKYLNGDTSLEEEQMLRHLLQDIPSAQRTDEEDALLLMLSATPTMTGEEDIFATDETEEYDRIVHQRKRRAMWKYTGIAAAIALVATLGFLLHTPADENIAVAYVNGEKVSDEQQVVAMMESTMNDVFAHSDTEEELYELFNPE